MASQKSARAAKIVQLLPRIEFNRPMLMDELASLYPQYRFDWVEGKGLYIHMPIGSIRLPQAVYHAAAVITQSSNSTERVYLKNRFGGVGKVVPGEEGAPQWVPPLPRTWHERLGEEFG